MAHQIAHYEQARVDICPPVSPVSSVANWMKFGPLVRCCICRKSQRVFHNIARVSGSLAPQQVITRCKMWATMRSLSRRGNELKRSELYASPSGGTLLNVGRPYCISGCSRRVCFVCVLCVCTVYVFVCCFSFLPAAVRGVLEVLVCGLCLFYISCVLCCVLLFARPLCGLIICVECHAVTESCSTVLPA